MTIKLKPMDQLTFDSFYEKSIQNFAVENVRAGRWKQENAVHRARETYTNLLTDGLDTTDHYLFSIMKDEEAVGILWIHVRSQDTGKQAFIYDINIDEEQQGKGYGKATMAALDEYARSQGITEIRLHVFAHNKRAISLYEKMGYEMTNYHMAKRLR